MAATSYKHIAKVTYVLMLICGILITAFSLGECQFGFSSRISVMVVADLKATSFFSRASSELKLEESCCARFLRYICVGFCHQGSQRSWSFKEPTAKSPAIHPQSTPSRK